jgi:hypothetical protein
MFSGFGDAADVVAPLPGAPTLAELRDALRRLAAHDGDALSDAELVDHIGAM